MDKLIKMDATIEYIKDIPTWWSDGNGTYSKATKYPDGMFDVDDIVNAIMGAPTVDATPVVHGKWIAEQKGAEYCEFRCSECDSSIGETDQFDETETMQFGEWYKYCPNCGAKMDKEVQDAK